MLFILQLNPFDSLPLSVCSRPHATPFVLPAEEIYLPPVHQYPQDNCSAYRLWAGWCKILCDVVAIMTAYSKSDTGEGITWQQSGPAASITSIRTKSLLSIALDALLPWVNRCVRYLLSDASIHPIYWLLAAVRLCCGNLPLFSLAISSLTAYNG